MKTKIHATAFVTLFMFTGAASAADGSQHAQAALDAAKTGQYPIETQDLNKQPSSATGIEVTAKARAEQRRARFERRLNDSLKGNAAVLGAGL